MKNIIEVTCRPGGKKIQIFIVGFLFLVELCHSGMINAQSQRELVKSADSASRQENLERIVSLLPPDRTSYGHVSFHDTTFKDWLKRTGELPPDFEKLPSIPFLPNPLILDEGGENVPVKTLRQWQEKCKWMKDNLTYYITGSYPPVPDNMQAEILSEKKDGQVILQNIELTFGPERKAKLTVELMIPPGEGPFPVFLTQWNHREWAQIAVRRGYMACVCAAADSKDDTEFYAELWANGYDFSRLMRRAWGTSRAVDYLYALPFVDKDKIGLTGHSRNGKLSLITAAFDERISAVIPSSGGTGGQVPWRYNSHKYDAEDLALLTCAQPAWFHPRLRFFVGRENKLPVDQNLFMALIAPRGLMLSTAINEPTTNCWGVEQAFFSTGEVYRFLNAGDNLAIRFRQGVHGVCARDIEDYIDFFDYIFKRNDIKPENKLLFNYTFENWCKLTGEQINPLNFPAKNIDDLKLDENGNEIHSTEHWKKKKADIQKRIKWVLGDEPSGITNKGYVKSIRNGGRDESSFGHFLTRPLPNSNMGILPVNPSSGFGDMLYGYLYYPVDWVNKSENKKLPVVIYLHEYDYTKGFSSYGFDHEIQTYFEELVNRGIAVFSFDMMGFGNRIGEGHNFYNRYPRWSKMGKLVADLKGALTALTHIDFVDSAKLYITGYSLGATVALYAAALDERIAGVVTVAGFTPMRLDTPEKGSEGIKAFSHLHGLLPKLGFFVGKESHIPYDFHEILACIAPRPLLVIAPKFDKDAHHSDVEKCVQEAKGIYQLYGQALNISIYSPEDYNRYYYPMRKKTYEWITGILY